MSIRDWPREAKLTLVGIIVAAVVAVFTTLLSTTQVFGLTRSSSPQPVQIVGTVTGQPPSISSPRATASQPLTIQLSHRGGWVESLSDLGPASTFDVLVTYRNTSRDLARNVAVRLEWPDPLAYAADSTFIVNGNYPNGVRATGDDLLGGGIIIGNYNPGILAYVKATGFVIDSRKLSCGRTTFTIRADITFDRGKNLTDEAPLTVNKHC